MTLQIGDKGQHVMTLQAALQDAGFRLPAYGVDGIFGHETQAAVRRVQEQFLLAPTGIADQQLFDLLDIPSISAEVYPGEESSPPPYRLLLLAGLALGAIVYAAKQARGARA